MRRPERSSVDERAREVLRANDRGGYTVPTAGLYPFQWNWDSAFAAWGWSTFDVDRAWTEIEMLLSGQWESGMIPHIVFHRPDDGYFPGPEVWRTGRSPATSGISQPPVLASMVRRVFDVDPAVGAVHLRTVFPRLVASHRWWREVRCGEGPASIVHPWESGRDNAATWDVGLAHVDVSTVEPYERRDLQHVDASMRPGKLDYDRYVSILEFGRSVEWDHRRIVAEGSFLMADPAISCILVRAHRDLAELARSIGELDTGRTLDSWADDLVTAMEVLWNPAMVGHDALDLRSGRFASSVMASAGLEHWAGIGDERIDARFDAVCTRVRFGVPTEDPASTAFERRRYWRGPTWPFLNSLVAIGRAEHGRDDEAERIRSTTEELIVGGGFAEYFDPLDGTALGGREFTWTAAVWLTWIRDGPSTVRG